MASKNFAFDVQGHVFMVENGDEDLTDYKDNIVVKSVPTFLGLADDMTPAAFWLPMGTLSGGTTSGSRRRLAIVSTLKG